MSEMFFGDSVFLRYLASRCVLWRLQCTHTKIVFVRDSRMLRAF